MNTFRILISMHYMQLGGAESALLGLLQALDPNRVDIDLFIYDHRGELMKYIPEYVNLLPQVTEYSVLEHPIVELIKDGYWGIALGRLIARFLYLKDSKQNIEHRDNISIYHFIANCVSPFLPKINPFVEYDLAISFLLPHQYVLKKVKAKKKLAWLHTDYSKVYVSKKELPVWKGFDYIAAISEDVSKGFAETFPTLKEKLIPIENILSPTFIRTRANEFDVKLKEKEDELVLLTIGRYSYPKRLDEVGFIASIIQKSLQKQTTPITPFKWYIIGFGSESAELEIRRNIEEYGMEKQVILLGKKTNPYPYIKACDIYVQPSRYEGKSITVREAQILGKPVAITDYPTAASQVKNEIDGIIVPYDSEGAAKGIAAFMMDNFKHVSISTFLKGHDYGNEFEVTKIYKLIQ